MEVTNESMTTMEDKVNAEEEVVVDERSPTLSELSNTLTATIPTNTTTTNHSTWRNDTIQQPLSATNKSLPAGVFDTVLAVEGDTSMYLPLQTFAMFLIGIALCMALWIGWFRRVASLQQWKESFRTTVSKSFLRRLPFLPQDANSKRSNLKRTHNSPLLVAPPAGNNRTRNNTANTIASSALDLFLSSTIRQQQNQQHHQRSALAISLSTVLAQQNQDAGNRKRSKSSGSLNFLHSQPHPPSSSKDSVFMGSRTDILEDALDYDPYYYHATTNYDADEQQQTTSTTDLYYWLHKYFNNSQYQKTIKYYGPYKDNLVYDTWTPPPTWTEASRNVLPQFDHRLPLQRQLEFQLQNHTIGIHPPSPKTKKGTTIGSSAASPPRKSSSKQKSKSSTTPMEIDTESIHLLKEPVLELPISQVSIHVQNPSAGVLDLYIKESSREEWMEHTFVSASSAAQFQMDLLALQLLGPAIGNMYSALNLLHQGSMAFDGKEFVLHDNRVATNGTSGSNEDGGQKDSDAADGAENQQTLAVGIAWDDVMRCLGSSFPSIRLKLEAVWWMHATESIAIVSSRGRSKKSNTKTKAAVDTTKADADAAETEKTDTMGLKEEYVKTRLLLGLVDFFRLFVPRLPETAVAHSSSSKARVEQVLRWTKRVARASVLVKSYVEARTVVNQGWKLGRKLPDVYWKRRLAFDDNLDNTKWDASANNEYYEPTVSRDILCQVRGEETLEPRKWWNFGIDRTTPTMSLSQGYSLVGVHTFRVASNVSLLAPGVDPVVSLPSIRAMIEKNSHLDFFVACINPGIRPICHVMVYVRTLPKGIDPTFDNVVERYTNGDHELRDDKFELVFQLGTHHQGLSWMAWFSVILLHILARLKFGDDFTPFQSTVANDRTPLPALKACRLGDTYHFGGGMRTNRRLPANYLAHYLYVHNSGHIDYFVRIFLRYILDGGLASDVVDLTCVLAGQEADELPERALTSVRIARAHLMEIALHPSYITPKAKLTAQDFNFDALVMSVRQNSTAFFFRDLMSDIVISAVQPIVRVFSGRSDRRTTQLGIDKFVDADALEQNPVARVEATQETFEKAVNELVRILEDVQVPVRKDQLLPAGVYSSQAASVAPLLSITSSAESTYMDREDLIKIPILRRFSRRDLLRYFIASGCYHKKAVVRLVQSASWHGLTFPIDVKACRVELQTGQFFQQGIDKVGNPVFYFRNMCLGYWRGDENAAIAAVLHRFDKSIKTMARENPDVRCTLVILMGKPKPLKIKPKEATDEKESDQTVVDEDDNAEEQGAKTNEDEEDENEKKEEEDEEEAADHFSDDENDGDAILREGDLGFLDNPRIEPEEHYHVHSTKLMVRSLIGLLMAHYPERLHRALIVVGYGNTSYTRTVVGGAMKLKKYVDSSRTRDKVRFLHRYSELYGYIDKNELVSIAGGSAPIHPDAFEAM